MPLLTHSSCIIILVWMFFPNSLFAQKNQLNTSSILKSETCWVYTIQDNAPTSTNYKSSVTLFDSLGNKTKITTFNPQGEQLYVFYVDYNQNTQTVYWINSKGIKVNSQLEEYNVHKELLQQFRYGVDGKQLDVTVFEYKDHQKSKETYYDSANNKIYSIVYSYNPTQKVIRETYTDFLSNETFLGATDLNPQSQSISYTQYKSTGPLEKMIQYERDTLGHITSKKTISPATNLELLEHYEYNKDNTKCFIYLGPDKQLIEHTIYTLEYWE